LPSCAFFGIDGAAREHSNWLRRVEWYANRWFIDDPWLRITRHGHEHNCSLAVVLTRWLRAAPTGDQQVVVFGDAPAAEVDEIRARLRPEEHLTLDPMPRGRETWSIGRFTHADRSRIPRFHIADLSATSVQAIWLALELLAIAGAAVAIVRTRRRPDSPLTFASQSG
jgi:hypothetical protein